MREAENRSANKKPPAHHQGLPFLVQADPHLTTFPNLADHSFKTSDPLEASPGLQPINFAKRRLLIGSPARISAAKRPSRYPSPASRPDSVRPCPA